MKREKNNLILGCLDLTRMDDILIDYGMYLASLLQGAELYFVHTIQYYDIRIEGAQDEEERRRVIEESVRAELLELIRRRISRFPAENLLLREDREDAALAVIETAGELSADYILVGEKEGAERSKWYSRRITRECSCHTLVIPEGPENSPQKTSAGELRFQRILYAGDFTQNSDQGLSFARHMAAVSGAELSVQYLRDRTSSYYPAESRPGDAEQRKQEKEIRQALKRTGIAEDEVDHRFHWEKDRYENEAQRIYEAALTQKADLLLTAAGGKTNEVTTLIGNLIVTMSKIEKTIPILYYNLR